MRTVVSFFFLSFLFALRPSTEGHSFSRLPVCFKSSGFTEDAGFGFTSLKAVPCKSRLPKPVGCLARLHLPVCHGGGDGGRLNGSCAPHFRPSLPPTRLLEDFVRPTQQTPPTITKEKEKEKKKIASSCKNYQPLASACLSLTHSLAHCLSVCLSGPLLMNIGAARDDKERISIDNRRARDESRRQRLIDSPKLRTIGIDRQALDAQVLEKQRAKAAEADERRTFDEYSMAVARQADIVDSMVLRERKTTNEELKEFWRAQTKDGRREYDLNDPHSKALDAPARLSDDDPRCGPASMQKFDGEDLEVVERKKLQQQQLQNWLSHQHAEKLGIKEHELAQNRQYEKYAEQVAFMAHETEQMLIAERRKMNEEVKEENLALAKARRETERRRQAENTIQSMEETAAVLSAPHLNEVEETTISAKDPTRFRPDHFKHLRADQYQAILAEREQQLRDKQARLQSEKEEEKAWAEYMAHTAHVAELAERHVQRERAAIAQSLRETHKEQANEKKKRYDELFNVTYANKVDDSFFSGFGKSCR